MPTPVRLEVFEAIQEPDTPVFLMPDEIEDIRLNAYEKGYVAGWDDHCQQEQVDEVNRRKTIDRQIEQLTFSYHDARGHVLKSIEPVLQAILGSVLPAAARASVVPLVLEQLLPLAHSASEAPITLNVAAGTKDAYLAAFEGQVLPPINLVEVDDLPEFAARFASNALETQIDLSHAAERIQCAVQDFYQLQNEETRSA